MAGASAHDKQMEDLMGAEIFVACVEQRKLQRVDNAADGVDDAACEQPAKCRRGERINKLRESEHT